MKDVSPAEAIYGFAAWLTMAGGTLLLGAEHDAAIMADLCEEYRLAQGWDEPREGVYPTNLVPVNAAVIPTE